MGKGVAGMNDQRGDDVVSGGEEGDDEKTFFTTGSGTSWQRAGVGRMPVVPLGGMRFRYRSTSCRHRNTNRIGANEHRTTADRDAGAADTDTDTDSESAHGDPHALSHGYDDARANGYATYGHPHAGGDHSSRAHASF